jgi:hypothetical protein
VSNRFGQAYGLTLFSPILPGATADGVPHDSAIRAELQTLLRANESPLVREPTTHLARWVVIDHPAFEGIPADVDQFRSSYLLFTSNFDAGSASDRAALDRYLESIRTTLPDVLDRLYAHCVGYPGASDRTGFLAYMRQCQIPTSFLFGAYGDAALDTVLSSLELQRGLGALVADMQRARLSPQALKDSVLAFASSHPSPNA